MKIKKMKKILGRLPSMAGFTMIELLVVIAIIGILAVAVLSSINPIEQINKGRDTRLRSNAAQLINALDRYYAIQEEYTWNTMEGDLPSEVFPDGADDGNAGTSRCATTTLDTSYHYCNIGGGAAAADWITALADTEEVKQSYVDSLNDASSSNVLYLLKPANGDVSICFLPASNQFKLEALKACATTPNPGNCLHPADHGTSYDVPDVSAWADEMICLP